MPTKSLRRAKRRSLWEKYLTDLSNDLKVTETNVKNGKKIANQLFRELQEKSKYKIDRTRITGSVEKGTAIKTDYDFDLVIFVNNIELPFIDVVEDFEKILRSINFTVIEKNNKKRQIVIKAVKEGIRFDICIAINFDQNIVEQRVQVLKIIKELPNPPEDSYEYSPSLDESQVEFVKKQSSYAHDLIRLAKYWNKSLFIEEYISGRSSLIELVAIDVAKKQEALQEAKSDTPLLIGFESFLMTMINFSNSHIIYERFYPKNSIARKILSQKPLILDPTNPFNNFADFNREKMMLFEKFAKVTWGRLSCNFDTKVIFRPQPKAIACKSMMKYLPPLTNWKIGIRTDECIKKPKSILRGKTLSDKKVESIRTFLLNNIKRINSNSWEKIEKFINHIIDYSIYGRELERVISHNDHDEYDVTFEIPAGKNTIVVSVDIN
jgi:hypothetical protein